MYNCVIDHRKKQVIKGVLCFTRAIVSLLYFLGNIPIVPYSLSSSEGESVDMWCIHVHHDAWWAMLFILLVTHTASSVFSSRINSRAKPPHQTAIQLAMILWAIPGQHWPIISPASDACFIKCVKCYHDRLKLDPFLRYLRYDHQSKIIVYCMESVIKWILHDFSGVSYNDVCRIGGYCLFLRSTSQLCDTLQVPIGQICHKPC